MRKKLLLLFSLLALLFVSTYAQTPSIKGTVKNEQGTPVPSASIRVKGSNTGTQSDDAGNFTLTVAPGKMLLVSAIGYGTIEVKAQDNLAVVLKSTNSSLTEVVVTANAIKREQRSLGYAASTIKAAELTVGQSSSALTSLSGKVAGVNVTS